MLKKRVAVLLADGFEEGEAVVFIDIMRRLDIEVDVLSCMQTTALKSYFETRITADHTLDSRVKETYDALMMPGGPVGTDNLSANPQVISFIKRHMQEGKYICALCSSGAKVLAAHALLEGKNYTTGDGLSDKYADGNYQQKKVVIDGNIVTGRGLGVSFEFAFSVAKLLLGDERDPKRDRNKVDWQADHIYFEHWPVA